MTRSILPSLILLAATQPVLAAPASFALTADEPARASDARLDLLDAPSAHARLVVTVGGETLSFSGAARRVDGDTVGDLTSADVCLVERVQGLAGPNAAWTARFEVRSARATVWLQPERGGAKAAVRLTGTADLGPRDAANEAVIERFYTAFKAKDAAAMAAEYAPDVHFSDAVFPDLRGSEAGSMWAMLCESEDLVLTFSGIQAGERYGVARWEARYSLFGNPVHNVIEASFELEDGEIVRHVDEFDFRRWSDQAMRQVKWLPTSFLLRTVRFASARQLRSFIRKSS